MGANIWFISDTHFWHQNMYSFVDAGGRRIRERFVDAAEGDAYMIQRWADLVRGSDHIYHLGDVCMNRENHGGDAFVRLIRSLPGHKRLVLGNHDHLKIKWYIEAGFEKIRGSAMVDGLLLTHYPVHPSSIGFKVIGAVHGHTHQQPDISPKHLNVSVERTDYAPISLDEVKAQFAEKARLASITVPVVDAMGTLITGP